MTMLSKVSKQDNFNSHNSLKPVFTNVCGFPSIFVSCEFFLEPNSSAIIVCARQTRKAQLTLAISFWTVVFLHSEGVW